MSYLEIQGLVLDASFDDLLPLAQKVMPDSWSKLLCLFKSTQASEDYCDPSSWMFFRLFSCRTFSDPHSEAVYELKQCRTALQVSRSLHNSFDQIKVKH